MNRCSGCIRTILSKDAPSRLSSRCFNIQQKKLYFLLFRKSSPYFLSHHSRSYFHFIAADIKSATFITIPVPPSTNNIPRIETSALLIKKTPRHMCFTIDALIGIISFTLGHNPFATRMKVAT